MSRDDDDDEEFLIRCIDSDDEENNNNNSNKVVVRRYAARAQRFTPHFKEQIDLKQTRFTYQSLSLSSSSSAIVVDLEYRLNGTGSSLWDSSIVLLKYLERTHCDDWRGKRVLDLGAGVGLVGLVLALYGAHVTLTDIGECLHMLRRNIDANRATIAASGRGGAVDCDELFWSATSNPPAKLLVEPYDYILATDCLLPYNADLLLALSHTINRLMLIRSTMTETTTTRTVAIVTFEERFDVRPFFDSCAALGLVASTVSFDEFDVEYRDEAIKMIKLQRNDPLRYGSKSIIL